MSRAMQMREGIAPTRDRLTTTVFMAALVHGVIIVGVTFGGVNHDKVGAPGMKVLDAGAYGVICPMVNSKEEAERFVGACRYPPEGYRSFGPTRVSFYAGAMFVGLLGDRDAMADLELLEEFLPESLADLVVATQQH